MGFVVNKRRFKQSGVPFLLPYSNKSNVVTYLTPDNFKGSDSTVWGDEYAQPMNRTPSNASWELSSDGKSVHIYNLSSSIYSLIISAPSNLYNFTVYIVAQYAGDDIKLYIRGNNSRTAFIFYDTSKVVGTTKLGSVFSNWTTNCYDYFSDTAYETFKAYAISYPRNDKSVHVLNNSVRTFSTANSSYYPVNFYFSGAHSTIGEAYIKLLAIVSEAESSTVLQNNINYIRTQLNLT